MINYYDTIKNLMAINQPRILADYLKMIPFVIDRTKDEKIFIKDDYKIDRPLDLPFENISIQLLNDKLMISIVERGPFIYTFHTAYVKDAGIQFNWYNLDGQSSDEDKRQYKKLYQLVEHYLSIINKSSQAIGQERSIKNKTSIGKKKQYIKLNNLIYCSKNKKQYLKFEKIAGHKLNFCFNVRGHWRKIKGIGKNRENDYTIDGYTWIKDYKKGDKNKLLNKAKLRIVK